MNWWVKTINKMGQIMTINNLENVIYSEAKKVFGPPHETKEFDTGTVFYASWTVKILGEIYTIRFDADVAAREKWHDEEGRNQYTIPSVEHEIVKSGDVVGEPILFRNVIRPFLMMIIKKKYDSNAATKTIKYVFEDIERYR